MALKITDQIKRLEKLVLGVHNKTVKISADSILNGKGYQNVFDISFSTAGSTISWQVIYDENYPDFAPDIIVEDNFLPDIKELNSFKNWNGHPDSLLKMIEELHDLFLIHQQNLLIEYKSLHSELQEYLSKSKENCEVSFMKDDLMNTVVILSIPLKIDSNILPEYISMDNNIYCGCLSLQYSSPKLSTVKPSLELLQSIESALGGATNMRIPSYIGATLFTYVEKVKEMLANSVEFVGLRYKRRKALIVEMLSSFSGCVIEFDSNRFFEASFLISTDSFYFILKVILSEHYPLEQPSLVLQSIYNIQSKLVNMHKLPLPDFNFNSQMDPKETLENIKKCVLDNIDVFKQSCLKKL